MLTFKCLSNSQCYDMIVLVKEGIDSFAIIFLCRKHVNNVTFLYVVTFKTVVSLKHSYYVCSTFCPDNIMSMLIKTSYLFTQMRCISNHSIFALSSGKMLKFKKNHTKSKSTNSQILTEQFKGMENVVLL